MGDRPLAVRNPADLAEAFRWSERRTVSKTALVSLHGNRCQVRPPNSSASESSWSSTPSISPSCASVSMGRTWGPLCHSRSADTPAPRPAPKHRRRNPHDDRDQLCTDDAVGPHPHHLVRLPHAVNNLCLQALVAAFAAGKSLVDEKAAQPAVTEVLD
jgi:hypothetical protein